jgi:hypothetical protein
MVGFRALATLNSGGLAGNPLTFPDAGLIK